MKKRNTEEMEKDISNFYKNVHRLIQERNLKWKDLALLINLDPRVLSSMKSQNQNPGLLTIKKIAQVLDVSLDELVEEAPAESNELNELIWALRRLAKDQTIDINKLSRQLLNIAYSMTESSILSGHRDIICENEAQYKLDLAKTESSKTQQEDKDPKTILY